MIFKNLAQKLERIIGLRNDDSIEQNKETQEDIIHFKKILKGDYTDIIHNFKNNNDFSLQNVSDNLKNDKFVASLALEKSLTDMKIIGSKLIKNTSSMQDLLKQSQENNSLQIPSTFGSENTNTVSQRLEADHIEGLKNLLNNKDYKKEFNNLYPEQSVNSQFLSKNKDVYIKLYEAVENTLAQNLRSINQNTMSTNTMTM